MSTAIICDEASKADLPDVLRLYAQLGDEEVLPLPEAERLFERIARYPDYRIYVARCEGRIVGAYALLIMDNLAHMGMPSAVIEDVAVDGDWQGRGVGKLMMQHALRLCSEKGCYKVMLSSNAKRERAHRFYESLDFERHGYSFRTDLGQAGLQGQAEAKAAPGKPGSDHPTEPGW
jgi:GNAT superfamily N-acetyltransferase